MFFRFLFGLQKGSRVWGKAPLLLFMSGKSEADNFMRKIKR